MATPAWTRKEGKSKSGGRVKYNMGGRVKYKGGGGVGCAKRGFGKALKKGNK